MKENESFFSNYSKSGEDGNSDSVVSVLGIPTTKREGASNFPTCMLMMLCVEILLYLDQTFFHQSRFLHSHVPALQ